MGFAPDEFWKQTPRTFQAVLKGKARANERELDQLVYAGYLTAALGRVKKMPKLKDVLPSTANNKTFKKTPQPWEHMLSAARQWSTTSK